MARVQSHTAAVLGDSEMEPLIKSGKQSVLEITGPLTLTHAIYMYYDQYRVSILHSPKACGRKYQAIKNHMLKANPTSTPFGQQNTVANMPNPFHEKTEQHIR